MAFLESSLDLSESFWALLRYSFVIVGSIGHTPSHATVLLLGHFVVTLIAGKIDLFFEHYPIEPRRARHLCF